LLAFGSDLDRASEIREGDRPDRPTDDCCGPIISFVDFFLGAFASRGLVKGARHVSLGEQPRLPDSAISLGELLSFLDTRGSRTLSTYFRA
jgi:hypothetical protein